MNYCISAELLKGGLWNGNLLASGLTVLLFFVKRYIQQASRGCETLQEKLQIILDITMAAMPCECEAKRHLSRVADVKSLLWQLLKETDCETCFVTVPDCF